MTEASTLVPKYLELLAGVKFPEGIRAEKDADGAESAVEKMLVVVDSGCAGNIFLGVHAARKDELDVGKFCEKLFEYFKVDKMSRRLPEFRFCHRIYPVDFTCPAADLEKIRKCVKELLDKRIESQIASDQRFVFEFAVEVKSVNCESFRKQELIDSVVGVVEEKLHGNYRINLSNPKYLIFLYLLKATCSVGIVKDFIANQKYNIQKVQATES